jgi:hypothetical protein
MIEINGEYMALTVNGKNVALGGGGDRLMPFQSSAHP